MGCVYLSISWDSKWEQAFLKRILECLGLAREAPTPLPLIGVISRDSGFRGKEEGEQEYSGAYAAKVQRELHAVFEDDRSLCVNLLILDRYAMIYFTGDILVQVQDGSAAPGKEFSQASDSFHACPRLGDIAQLVSPPCTGQVITGWMSTVCGGWRRAPISKPSGSTPNQKSAWKKERSFLLLCGADPEPQESLEWDSNSAPWRFWRRAFRMSTARQPWVSCSGSYCPRWPP
ncbi:hypothetical protein H6P81_021680 [Aristolochia fimbriata]|uniref:Uncharacterized protein n=1 Tax=Aristolochia fimbriata TaxID=158543 RepID=A0AAV7DSB6_ARIFI|nr:hypothetical protein H6P81_021680 [Aristolochia fimbriata]